MLTATSLLLLASFAPASSVAAFVAHGRIVKRPTIRSCSTNTVPGISTTSRAMSLRPVYDEACRTVTGKLGLQLTDFSQSYQAQIWRGATAEGTADWWTETSPQFLTGVSTLTRLNQPQTNQVAEELTVNIWMGPSYDLPHMLLTFGLAGGDQYYVTADYVPRGPTVLGGDPQYLEQYYGADVQNSWLESYRSPGAMALPPPAEFETRLLDSPARISVVGISQDAAAHCVRQHLNRCLAWLERAQPVPARSRGAFNLRDDKLRQYFFRGQVKKQTALLGDELGRTVAAVNTGPTAEAYVGGGS